MCVIVKIYGRAGQGVDLARKVIGDAALLSGFFVEDNILRGLERRKSDVIGYIKFEKSEFARTEMHAPDISLVFDMKFDKDAISDTNEKGMIIFNTPDKIKNAVLKKKKIKCFHVDADDITLRILSKKAIPNMPMLGAFAKTFSKISVKNIKKSITDEIGENREASLEFDEGYKTVKRC